MCKLLTRVDTLLWSLSFSVGSIFRQVVYLILTLRSQVWSIFTISFTFYRRAFAYLEPVRPDNTWQMISPDGNVWPLFTFLKGCVRWGQVVAASASPRSRTQKSWLSSYSLPLFTAVISTHRMVHNTWHSRSYCLRHSRPILQQYSSLFFLPGL